MVVVPNLLNRLAKRFGVQPISAVPPEIQHALKTGNEQFQKAPAGFEPLITGGGYEWDDSLNGYRLGQGQKIFLLPNGAALWVFKDAVVRMLAPDSIQKWVSADSEYPMGKANAFFKIYGYLTGQDLGEGETAGDNVQDGETPPGDEGGIATADEEGGYFSKQDIQNMLAGDYSAAGGGPKNTMQSSIPKAGVDRMAGSEEPEVPEEPLSGPVPDRSGIKPVPGTSEAEKIIKTLYAKAGVNPKAKLSKQNPIRLDPDEILDLYQRAKQMPPEEGEKIIAFLKSGAVKPLEEGKISKATLAALMEHIVNGIVKEIENAKAKAKAKKQQDIEEMTTTSGGGGSSAGTPGYMVPGAFKGNDSKKKDHIEVLGYKLTPQGKQELDRSPDKLYEAIAKKLRKKLSEASGLGADFDRAQRAYDNQVPPDDHTDDEGGCAHKWKFEGEAKDGTRYYRCVYCGETDES